MKPVSIKPNPRSLLVRPAKKPLASGVAFVRSSKALLGTKPRTTKAR